MAEILVAGHICLDIIPRFGHAADIVPGQMIEVGQADISTGGCVPNVGRALHRLGVDVRLVGKVADDQFGEIIHRLLKQESPGLGDGLLVAKGGTTSYTIVINPPGRDRTFLHMPGENNTFGAGDLISDGVRVVHFGYPPLMARMYADEGAELEAVLAKVRASGAAVSLDMSLPDPDSNAGRALWRRILERVLPYVDFFFPSEEELEFMLGGTDAGEMASECVGMGAGVLVATQGSRGLICRTSDEPRVRRIPGISDPEAWAGQSFQRGCFPVTVVGTTGAGDATVAGFLMGFIRGFVLPKCLDAGCAVGACCVEASDAVSGIRSWEETERRFGIGPC